MRDRPDGLILGEVNMATTATKAPAEIVKDAYDALLGNGNLDAFMEVFDDKSVMREATTLPYGGTYVGRDAIRKGIEGVFGYFSSFGYEVHQITSGGDYVIAYGTFSATSAKNGKSVSFPLAEVWKFDGERVEFIEPIYFDVKAVADILAD